MDYKQEQRAAKASIRRVTDVEPLQDVFHDEEGNLTNEGLKALRTAQNAPQEHHTVNLSIREFKKYIRENHPYWMKKREIAEAIRRYKQKAWVEYGEIVKHKGSFPAHPQYT